MAKQKEIKIKYPEARVRAINSNLAKKNTTIRNPPVTAFGTCKPGRKPLARKLFRAGGEKGIIT